MNLPAADLPPVPLVRNLSRTFGAFAAVVLLAACGGGGGGETGATEEAPADATPAPAEGTDGVATATDGAASPTGAADTPAGDASAWAPEQPVTMIVPFAAGGGSDILGRFMAQCLEEVTDATVTVENRVGGSGAVGYSYLLEQAGNPHFLLATETAGIALPATTEVAFSPDDFTDIAQIAEDAVVMIVPTDSEFATVEDVLTAAGEGQVTLGISGATGVDNVVATLLEDEAGVTFQRVVFQSGGELVAALLGGDIDIAMLNPGEVIGQLEAGDMRGLVVFAEQPYEDPPLSEVPTSVDEGYEVTFSQYRGAIAAGDITEDQQAYWVDAFRQCVETDTYSAYIDENFLIPTQRFGDEFDAYLGEYQQLFEAALGEQG